MRERPEASTWSARGVALLVTAVVTAPLLAPGFVLAGDMVFVPRQDLDADALGLGGALPRAVPADAALALVTGVVPGDVVQKVVLCAMLYVAVLGTARLVTVVGTPSGSRVRLAGTVSGLVYGWSAYVAERLLMGHWSLLLAYAALPWIVLAALRVRRGEPGALAGLVVAVAPAALSPTGGILAAGVAVAVTARHRPVAVASVLAVSVLPWVAAALAHPAGGLSDPAGVAAFAARAENPAGVLAALLGTGGIWNGAAVPAGRESAVVPLVTGAVLVLAVAGWSRRGALRGPGGRLLLLGVGGLLLGAAGAVGPLAGALDVVVAAVPGAGLLRDGQKWVAWWALVLAPGAGLGAARAAQALADRGMRTAAVAAAGAAVVLPVLGVPDLAWGVGGRLAPVGYPDEWDRVRAVLVAEGGDRTGAVLVLPPVAVRSFAWNDGRTQLDPAPRYLPGQVVVTDDLVVSGRPVTGEDLRARAVVAAAGEPAALAALGVGWVLVQRDTPGPPVPPAVEGLMPAVDGHGLDLFRVPGAVPAPAPTTGRTAVVVGAHLLWMVAVLAASVRAATSRAARRRAARTGRGSP